MLFLPVSREEHYLLFLTAYIAIESTVLSRPPPPQAHPSVQVRSQEALAEWLVAKFHAVDYTSMDPGRYFAGFKPPKLVEIYHFPPKSAISIRSSH